MLKKLIQAIDEAVIVLKKELQNMKTPEVTLFHHNDTDGLSSGTILLNAFKRTGCKVNRFSLEKTYPQVLEKIFSKKDQVIIFTDFAGKIAPIISRKNNKKNLVIILDHHPAEKTEDDTVINLDGELFGLKGDRDISASSTCYLFADILLRSYDKDASDLSHLGVLGAVGDGFLVDGSLSGVNKDILATAVNQGLIRVEKKGFGEEYFITLGNTEYSAIDIAVSLDTLGGVGYYSDGTARGIEVCQSGLSAETVSYIAELEGKKETIFSTEIENLKTGLHSTDYIQWFNVEDRFKPMGVKMIGVFCTLIKDSAILDETKYLAAFQHIPDMVPGFGNIDFNATKISMRASNYLTDKIRNNTSPGLNSFLPAATETLGGFSDACHRLSAATTVTIGMEEKLILETEKELKKRMEEQ